MIMSNVLYLELKTRFSLDHPSLDMSIIPDTFREFEEKELFDKNIEIELFKEFLDKNILFFDKFKI